MPAWKDYQETVAEYFRSLGFSAETDVELTGVRTTHDVDVVVRQKLVGFEIVWIVECKAWSTRVPKEKVFALRAIVDDVGVDRGLLMAEGGHQSGALEAARLTNVLLTSLEDLRELHSYEIGMIKLRKLLPRVADAERRYAALPKEVRIAHGLRPPVGLDGYSARRTLESARLTAVDALLATAFPIGYSEFIGLWQLRTPGASAPPWYYTFVASSPEELFAHLVQLVHEREDLLTTAETASL